MVVGPRLYGSSLSTALRARSSSQGTPTWLQLPGVELGMQLQAVGVPEAGRRWGQGWESARGGTPARTTGPPALPSCHHPCQPLSSPEPYEPTPAHPLTPNAVKPAPLIPSCKPLARVPSSSTPPQHFALGLIEVDHAGGTRNGDLWDSEVQPILAARHLLCRRVVAGGGPCD